MMNLRANPIVLIAAMFLAGIAVQGQVSPSPSVVPNRDAMSQPRNIRESLARFRTEKAKKDHAELLKRGEEAVELSEQLKAAFEKGGQLTSADLDKLESLEKVVSRIRRDLGGSDKDGDDPLEAGDSHPATVEDAFKSLWKMTAELGSELKKTSRFTVSAVAVQSSNSVLRLVKFLRLRK